ncbi:lysophospholipase [Sphingobacteriaceae bacterium]|nr:lysophospholipase [Sphingobacteriaceae bacterium]
MKNKIRYSLGFIVVASLLFSFTFLSKEKPTLFIIGDSTVKNGDNTGKDNLWGWGSFIQNYFDTLKISIHNDAIGGRSSKSFITDGRWDKLMSELKPGDFVIIQFGHNDRGPLDDTARARGTIKGTGEETKDIYNPVRKVKETVHTYGWYLRKYVNESKSKGAIPIICSLVPRNIWTNGRVERCNDDYTKWAKEVAAETKVSFIDLNNLVADKYEAMDSVKVKLFFPKDHTHTNLEGAKLNTETVVSGIKNLKENPLKNYLIQ